MAGARIAPITQFQVTDWSLENFDGSQAPRNDGGRVRLESSGATGSRPRSAIVSTVRGQFTDFSANLELALANSTTNPADYSGFINIGILGTTVASTSGVSNKVGRNARIGLRATGSQFSLTAQVLDADGNPITQLTRPVSSSSARVRIQVDNKLQVVRFFADGQLASTYVPTTLTLPGDSPLTVGAEGRNYLVFADQLQAVDSESSDTSFTLQQSSVGPLVTSPGLVQFLFTLRDQDDDIVNLLPSQLVGSNLFFQENGDAIDRVECNPILKKANLPQDVVVVLDYSQSMRQSNSIAAMVQGAKNLCSSVWGLNATSRIQLWEFHDTSAPVTSLLPQPTGAPQGNWLDSSKQTAAFARLDTFNPYSGFSRVYDAVKFAATTSFNSFPRAAIRSVVFLSDGFDTGSVATADILIAEANALDAALYPIGVNAAETQERLLRRLAADTGGGVYATDDVNSLVTAFSELGGDLGSLYSASYTSSRPNGTTRVTLDLDLLLTGATERRRLPIPVTADVSILAGDTRDGVLSFELVSFSGTNAVLRAKSLFTPRNVGSFTIGNYSVTSSPGGATPGAVVTTRKVQTGQLAAWTEFVRTLNVDRASGPALQFGDFGDFLEVTITGIPAAATSITLAGTITNTDLLPVRFQTTSGTFQANGNFAFTELVVRPTTTP